MALKYFFWHTYNRTALAGTQSLNICVRSPIVMAVGEFFIMVWYVVFAFIFITNALKFTREKVSICQIKLF